MLHRGRRAPALAVSVGVCVALAACGGQKLPESVVEGSEVTVGWSSTLTSSNAAMAADATPGNLDVAALTRGRFAELVDGEVVLDESFGAVEITKAKPFTVRYDLAEPTWSDGIPVDAADLVLAWATGSDGEGGFDAVPTGLALSERLAGFEESERAIEVAFSQPVNDWSAALDVAVPAHVLGQLALGVEDPMEAKKAVVDAIRGRDATALARLAETWNGDFRLSTEGADPELLVSSGPYRVTDISEQKSGAMRVELVANGEYTGKPAPSFERVELLEMSDEEKMEGLGKGVDVAQLVPATDRRKDVRMMERRDYGMSTSHDGTMWVLALRADGPPFARRESRAAFLRAVPRDDLTEAGGGAWADAYVASNAVVTAPESDGYEIALEDAGFEAAFGKVSEDPALERTNAGVPPGAAVCLLYDRRSSFAQNAYGVLRDVMAAAGWTLTDCGAPELTELSGYPSGWQAALIRVPVPRSAGDLTRWWGGDPKTNLPGLDNPRRDELIAEWARTVDRYDARDILAQIEKTLVEDAVVLPIAMNPVVTVRVPEVDGVSPRSGPVASLTSGIEEWGRAER